MPDGANKVELFFNDLSIDGQFPDLPTFKVAISRMMKMREIALQFGRELYCHRNVAYVQVTRDMLMQQAIQTFERNQRRSVMQWLTRHGPFWEDIQRHSSDDYLECNGEVVTDTAVGEAAYCCFYGTLSGLVSLTPSLWEFSPISVTWMIDDGDNRSIDVINHWKEKELKAALQKAPVPVQSWEQLAIVSIARCRHLKFSADCFMRFRGHPFVAGAARQILALLDTLDRFKCCFDEQGKRTTEGQQIYQDHFTGEKAWFSDSSDAEKREFRKDLTFPHPDKQGITLFCTWHGKVKSPQLRIHFSWPVRADEPLHVVYVGPKITKG